MPPLPISKDERLLFPARGPARDYPTPRQREKLPAGKGDTSSLANPTYGVESSSVFTAPHTSQLQRKASGISADASSNQKSPELDLAAEYAAGAMYEDGPVISLGDISGPSRSVDADVTTPLVEVDSKDPETNGHSHKRSLGHASNSENLVQSAVDGPIALFSNPVAG